MDGEVRHLLRRDQEPLLRAEPVAGVRLLPRDDPLLAVDRALANAGAGGPAPPVADDRGASVTPRLGNSLVHYVLVDGTIVGRWGRSQHHMAMHLWPAHRRHRERVLAEAESFAGPIGRPVHVRWLH